MKKLIMVIAMALAGVLVAQDKSMTLADARGKIGDVIADPASMTSVIKQLSAEDQVSFLSEVNAAISKMPGSTDEKTSTFLDVNTAALNGAQDGNLPALVAEVFATVPPSALTVVNERLAADVFNRAADPSKNYTDAQYTEIAKAVLSKVQDRTATADNAGVRDTFAILMLIRASNGSPADLRDTLVDSLRDPATKDLAQNEWISPALGIGQEKTYDPMLGAASAGEQPDLSLSLSLDVRFTDGLAALAADLGSASSIRDASSSFVAQLAPAFDDPTGGAAGGSSLIGAGATANIGATARPRTTDTTLPYNPDYKRSNAGSTHGKSTPVTPTPPTPPAPPTPEPGPYAGQTTF